MKKLLEIRCLLSMAIIALSSMVASMSLPATARLAKDGRLVQMWPKLISDSVTLESAKPVFLPPPKGVPANAVVLRLLNLSDKSAQATLCQKSPTTVMIRECNLLEEPQGETFELKRGQSKAMDFKPFKSRSFVIY